LHRQVGTSAGGFGGGPNDFFGNFEGRNDFDALAVWEVRNLGLGNRALQQQRASQQRQQVLEFQQISDRVATEVTQAYYRAVLSGKQVEENREQVTAAAKALPLNFRGIRGGELRVIEAQQAIRQLADSRQQYLQAVIENNQAQLQLLRAIGTPLDSPLSVPIGPSPQTDPGPFAPPGPNQ
jgi:outer membrane protein TolC